MNKAYALGLLVLLITPGALAITATDATLGITTYPIAANTFSISPSGAGGEVINFSYNASRPHAYEVTDHRLVMDVSFTHTVLQNSVGIWNVTVYQDGTLLSGCQYLFPTTNVGGFLAGTFQTYPAYRLDCIRTGATGLNNEDHNHTITVRYEVASGTPAAIQAAVVSFGIERRDIYMIPQDANEITEAIAVYWPIATTLLFLGLYRHAENNAVKIAVLLTHIAAVITAVVTLPHDGMRLFVIMIGFIPIIQALTLYDKWKKSQDEEPEEEK